MQKDLDEQEHYESSTKKHWYDPDFIIGSPERPYIRRWWLVPRNRVCNVYLHQILRSDDDRALHDHPWPNVSIVLWNRYREITPVKQGQPPHHDFYHDGLTHRIVKMLRPRFRRATDAHRLEIIDGPVWSLFITGPWQRTWGFRCAKGWVPWHEFVDATDHGNIGRGCE